MSSPESPKVFISYSWTSDEHLQWVLDLATRLRSDGVDVMLDRWDLKDGHDTLAFMEKMKTDAGIKKVLVICDSGYTKKANSRAGGVGAEAQIISPDVYKEVGQEKFVPIVRERDEDGKACVPVFMSSRLYIDFTVADEYEEKYERLLRNIFERPELKKPELGKPPTHIFQSGGTVVKTAGRFNRLREAIDKDRPHKDVLLRDYLDNLGDALEEFRIKEHDGELQPDDVVVDRIKQMQPYRDEFIEFCLLYATRVDTEEGYIEVHAFLERLLRLRHHSEGTYSQYDWCLEPHRFVGYEWVLYLLSALIHHRKYKTAARFMADEYRYQRSHRESMDRAGLRDFNGHMPCLEEFRKQRLKLNRHSLIADMIKESASHPRITFQKLFQTDMLLMIRPYLIDPTLSGYTWWPRLSAYAETGITLEVFSRATSTNGQPAIRELFGVKDARNLSRKMADAFKNPSLTRTLQTEEFRWGSVGEHLFNWGELRNLVSA